MSKIEVKYRTWHKGLPPRTTKLEVPGWAGDSKDYSDGAKPQPWMCPPFAEASCYGLELVYPFDQECRVTFDGNNFQFEGDFTAESAWDAEGKPPFTNFAPGHYGFTSSLDLQPPDGYVTRVEPHPRLYTDQIGDVPFAIAGHIQSWWPKIFFVVFKAPWPGQTHVFRKNQPYAQVLFLPKKAEYELVRMTPQEQTERSKLENNITTHAKGIKKHGFKSDNGGNFDDKYRQLAGAYTRGGDEGIQTVIAQAAKKKSESLCGKITGRLMLGAKNENVSNQETQGSRTEGTLQCPRSKG